MSWIVRQKSEAYRLRDGGRIVLEHCGPLHEGSPLLEWGSITKTVTARIAQQLDRAGIVDLSAPVQTYLPQTDLPPSVDVLSLVHHTSGLPRVLDGIVTTMAEARDPYAKYTPEYFDTQVLPELAAQHRGRIGDEEYSNLGYAVLTRVLEVATGHDWWTLAQQHVFTPLGITDVAASPDPDRVPVLRTWTGSVCRQWTDTGPFIGAGGLHGSLDALEQYAIALAQLTPGETPFGWAEDPTLWWHNGHNLDHGAFVGVSYDGERVITVHTLGYNAGRADRIAARLAKRPATGPA